MLSSLQNNLMFSHDEPIPNQYDSDSDKSSQMIKFESGQFGIPKKNELPSSYKRSTCLVLLGLILDLKRQKSNTKEC